jgi:hypothetical protein
MRRGANEILQTHWDELEVRCWPEQDETWWIGKKVAQHVQLSVEVDGRLVPEPEYRYDPLAVRVEVGGKKIGYLPKGTGLDEPTAAKVKLQARLFLSDATIRGDVESGALADSP